jgi:acylphosphatase
MGESVVRRRAVVSGVVQGVGFRWAARERADALGLAGYARNLFDGTVEVEAEGPAERVGEFLDWLATGPPSATVEAVRTTGVEAAGESGFRVG